MLNTRLLSEICGSLWENRNFLLHILLFLTQDAAATNLAFLRSC